MYLLQNLWPPGDPTEIYRSTWLKEPSISLAFVLYPNEIHVYYCQQMTSSNKHSIQQIFLSINYPSVLGIKPRASNIHIENTHLLSPIPVKVTILQELSTQYWPNIRYWHHFWEKKICGCETMAQGSVLKLNIHNLSPWKGTHPPSWMLSNSQCPEFIICIFYCTEEQERVKKLRSIDKRI